VHRKLEALCLGPWRVNVELTLEGALRVFLADRVNTSFSLLFFSTWWTIHIWPTPSRRANLALQKETAQVQMNLYLASFRERSKENNAEQLWYAQPVLRLLPAEYSIKMLYRTMR
jgi:hypothetical protein